MLLLDPRHFLGDWLYYGDNLDYWSFHVQVIHQSESLNRLHIAVSSEVLTVEHVGKDFIVEWSTRRWKYLGLKWGVIFVHLI